MAKRRTDDWWRSRLEILQQVAAEPAKIHPDVRYDREGFWPAIKLIVLQYALGFYAPIMRKQVEAGGWDSLHYIDTNAGNGINRLQSKNDPQCHKTIAGTALIGANTVRFVEDNKHFDRFHFIEPIQKFADALEARLAEILPQDSFKVYPEPAATAIPTIVTAMTDEFDNPHYFAVVDPEGLTEVTLPNLEPLFDLARGDLLFNFQYMACKRSPHAARVFFGDPNWDDSMSEDEVRKYFLGRLGDFKRPATQSFPVTAGKGSGRYAYDFVYCAAKTAGGSPWLANLRDALKPYAGGIKGSDVDNMFCAGQKTLI